MRILLIASPREYADVSPDVALHLIPDLALESADEHEGARPAADAAAVVFGSVSATLTMGERADEQQLLRFLLTGDRSEDLAVH